MTQNELDLSPSPALQRLGRAYSTLALLAFNLLLAFTCLNVAVLPFLPPHEEPLTFPDYRNGTLDYGMERLRLAYPHYDDTQIIRLLLETWNRHYRCDPDTNFTEMAYRGHFVNVSPFHFRHVKNQAPLDKIENYYTIFIFGGSTTFGYGEADWQTIPSHLQEILRSNSLSGNLPIAVFNFGQGHFTNLHEQALLQKLVRQGLVPNLAIFVDGLNDFYYWSGRPIDSKECVQDENLITRFLGCKEKDCLPAVRLLSSRLRLARPAEERPTPPPNQDVSVNRAVVERWIKQVREINNLSQANGFKALFVRQPVPGYAYDLERHLFADSLEALTLHARVRYGYPIWSKMVSEPDFSYLDLAYMSQDRQEALYVDLVHYSASFMRDIAQEIAHKVIDMLDEPTRHRLGLPRLDEPILRFGDSWSLVDWHRPADGLQACQSATLNTWWQPYALPTSADWHDAYLSVVLQNDQGVLLKREVLLASLRGSPDEQRLYPLAITLDIPCDAAPGPYDLALAMSLCQRNSGAPACAQQDAFTREGGLGAYPYLTTVQLGGG